MAIITIYLGKDTSLPNSAHKKYPYLLRGIQVNRVNQVWSNDINYIRLNDDFVYLCAVIDFYSRAVLSWELSNTMHADFCAIKNYEKKHLLLTISNTAIFCV
jgi:putative transposase